MSAVESDRTHGNNGSSAPVPTRARASGDVDIPGILAGQVATRYAASERERRNMSLERAIARARGTA